MPNLPRDIAVVIPTRGARPALLSVMLESVFAQTVQPSRVVVVQDGLGADIEDERVTLVKGVFGNGSSGNPARNAGARLFGPGQPYFLFLDDDDYIPPTFIQKLCEAAESEQTAGASYPVLRMFGDEEGTFAAPYDPVGLGRNNHAPVSSLIRGDAFFQVGGWPELAGGVQGVPYDDWAMWRRLRGLGWGMVQADTEYFYRRHKSSICSSIRKGNLLDWEKTIDLSYDAVTLAIPFSGRDPSRLLEAIGNTRFSLISSMLFYDTSRNVKFGERLREWLCKHGLNDARYVRDWMRPRFDNHDVSALELADAPRAKNENHHWVNHRVAGIWNRIGQLVHTDLVWCLEDDVIPPPDVLERLIAAFGSLESAPMVDGVTAAYPTRLPKGYVCAWKYSDLENNAEGTQQLLRGGVGVEEIDGCGFGCALVRRDVLSKPAPSTGEARWYDQNRWADIRRGGGCLYIDWTLRCEHLGVGDG